VKGRSIPYSPDELTWVEANCTLPFAEMHRAFCERFGRDDVSSVNLNALRKRKGWLTGRTGRFEPGQTPVNKGKKCLPGQGGNHPNARRTQFKKGSLSGRARERIKPIGTERVSKDGYLERKIHNGLPMQSRWRAIHLIRWESLHGPLPKGFALKCLDGDKANTDPSNWEAIPRAMLPRLNGRFGRDYDHAPAEVKSTIMVIAKLEHRARTIGSDD